MARADRVVTPEAVALDLQTATVATRGLAAFVDLVLQVLVGLLVGAALTLVDVDTASGAVVVTIVLVAFFLIRVGYPVLFETRFGATVGHMALGLRVVTLDGATIRARQALVRAAVGMFELDATLGSVALLTSAIRGDGRRLGDLAAGTQVVSTRTGTGPATALSVTVPPHLAGWAAALDTSGLQRPERTALRRYLQRAGDLPAAQRDALAGQLADSLLVRLAAERPAGASAHDALTAVAAVLNERDRAPVDLPPPPMPPPTSSGGDGRFEPPA